MKQTPTVVVMRPGYAYVPPQKLEAPYSPGEALEKGTLFPVLYLPMSAYGEPMTKRKGGDRRG